MSYTARPPFTGGMSNQNQQQQQGGQPNNANIGSSGIPNMPMMNNAASISVPGNHSHLTNQINPGGSSGMSVIDQKIFQQQVMLQRQLLLQSQQFQQQQSSQQNQQAKFQQQPNQTQALNRIMSEMLNVNEKNGSNVAQQTQQLQQFVQLQALTNMMQLQAATQKSFQQQSVPLPTNTTITPVARQSMQSMQKPPVNYPRPNVQTKNPPSNVGASPMQSRKSFPNAPKLTSSSSMAAGPPSSMQTGHVAAPLHNLSSGSSKSTLPQMPSAMTSASATHPPKGYADIFAATLSNSPASMNITPSLTITKTHSPSSSSTSSTKSGMSSSSSSNKAVTSMVTSQKSFLPEAISMSLGNVPISVKATQPPSVSVTPTNKPIVSPTNKAIPVTPQKLIVPQNVPGLQKLSPTSPRTKQTPRKNTNPIRTTTTTTLSPSLQTLSTLVVPQSDTKVTNPPTSISAAAAAAATASAKPQLLTLTSLNAAPVKPPTVSAVPATPPKPSANVSAAVVAQTPPKPVQTAVAAPASVTNSVVAPKANVATVKANPVVTSKESTPKVAKPEEVKSKETNVEKSAKVESVQAVKPVEASKGEKPAPASSSATPAAAPAAGNKTTESKGKSDSAAKSATTNKNQTSQEKDRKESKGSAASNAPKAEQVTKTPVARAAKAAQSSTSSASVATPSSAEVKIKRNRFKTIPYQSPTPEFELVSKISANEAINAQKKTIKKKVDDDKLTLFYKNEFLAVRNADGGFFLCQAINNVYKSSPKIRIRWLSEDSANKSVYGLDFYDNTDIECVLTSVSLNKIGKGKFQLTETESERIKNILKKALDVEKGIVDRPDVTEENPDGLDLSLYKDESQIEKKVRGKRKAQSKGASAKKASPAAKKRKIEATPSQQSSDESNSKARSAKKSPLQKSPTAAKKDDVQSTTPLNKRAATKRKLVNETTEVQIKEADTKKGSKDGDGGPEKKVSKTENESPKPTSEKMSTTNADAAEQTPGRPTRRSKN